MPSSSSGPQVEILLNSVFASRKRIGAEDERLAQGSPSTILPANFQVYAKIDEESRKDNRLTASFLVTLNDAKGIVTYEFRGICNLIGSSVDFESVMQTRKDARIPKILDMIYQRLYPTIFILAGFTASSFPQYVTLMTEMISTNDPIKVHEEEAEKVQHQEKSSFEDKIKEEKKETAIPSALPQGSPSISSTPSEEGSATTHVEARKPVEKANEETMSVAKVSRQQQTGVESTNIGNVKPKVGMNKPSIAKRFHF